MNRYILTLACASRWACKFCPTIIINVEMKIITVISPIEVDSFVRYSTIDKV